MRFSFTINPLKMRFLTAYKILFSLIFLLATTDLRTQIVATDSVYTTQSLGFSQAVVVNGFVFTSGQVGWDTNHALIGNKGFESQASQCFKNIELILIEAKSGMEKVVHLRFFVTEMTDKNKKIIGGLLKKYFPNAYQPTTTLVCVKALAREELMIEIEVVATTH
jgi:2-iminobutanoate/2-iminopropanoate deaminase